ncbi:MAG: hypothetical protein IKH60_03100 [Bacteroidales bacterium]|nr:hypothetical protein [Bacteroidales bacterium]
MERPRPHKGVVRHMGHGDAYELRISRLNPDVHPEQQIEVILYLLPRSYPPRL